MRIFGYIILVCGIAIAGVAAYNANQYLAMMSQNGVVQGPEMARVLTARVRLAYGDVVNSEAEEESLLWQDWPAANVPSGAFTNADDFFGKDGDQSRTVLATIEPNVPILRSMVSEFGEGVGLPLSPGLLGVTIKINAITGGGGHVSPGDHVDIELTRRIEKTMTSVILLRNVRVIAVDLSSDTQERGPRLASTVTVEVNTIDAQKLRLASNTGTLSLFLRAPGSKPTEEEMQSGPIDLSDLPGAPEPEVEPEPVVEEKKPQVRVRRGNAVTFEPVDD